MMLAVFGIFDSGVSAWMPPLYFRNKGEALRWFIEAVNNPETKLSKHPSDYSLFELGQWNDITCEWKILPAPDRLGLAIEFVRAVEEKK